jgi:TIR domain
VISPDQPVFISYSRRDYYFAESLAVQLLHRNVPAWLDVMELKPGAEWEQGLQEALEAASCFVLIASPNAMKSPNVRTEWTEAVHRGKRIVIAQFLGTPLPGELRGAEVVDFRGGFRRGLNRLIERLAAEAGLTQLPRPEPARLSPVPRLSAWVAAVAVALGVPMIVFFALSLLHGDMPADPIATFGTASLSLGVLAMLGLLLWFFCISFLRRRMGMTRLMCCFFCLAAIYVYPLVLLFLHGPAGLADYAPGVQPLLVNYWRVDLMLGAIPLAGLAVLLVARPVALLHWSPTGRAWNWYREHHVDRPSANWVDAATTLDAIGQFRLVYDMADTPAANRLRGELIKAGAKEMPPKLPLTAGSAPEAGTTAVLLLTNRTRTLWLNQQAIQNRGPVFTVVASAIGLPDSLAWLWKREWIDFRRWDAEQPESARPLPRLPEAVTTVRLPRRVLWALHLVCALGMLFFVACSLHSADEPSFILTPLSGFLLAGSVLGWAFLLPARGLVRRKITAARFARWTGWGACFGVLAALVGLYDMVARGGSWIRAVPAALFLVAAPVLLWRLRPQIAFWFPGSDAPKETRDDCLSPPRDWQTFFPALLYLSVWMLVLKDLSK